MFPKIEIDLGLRNKICMPGNAILSSYYLGEMH
jgi:hypothetical protein